jgi:hypothetical protein
MNRLEKGIIQAEEWIRSFEEELEEKCDIWNQLEAGSISPHGDLDPSLSQSGYAHWPKEHTKSWVYCTPHANELARLSQWQSKKNALPDIANKSAQECIELYEEKSNSGTYYEISDDDKPQPDETLDAYLNRIQISIGIKSERATKARGDDTCRRGWNSFLHFLRKLDPKARDFINQTFPEKLDIFAGKIIRIVAQEASSISMDLVRDILMKLVHMFKNENPQAKLTTLECLALIWICLTVSRLRLPVRISDLYELKASAIKIKGSYYKLLIPTSVGHRTVDISEKLANLLCLVSSIQSKRRRTTVLQSPRKSLSRTLDRTLTNLSIPSCRGNITYVTFMSPPHCLGKTHRSQLPMKSKSKEQKR